MKLVLAGCVFSLMASTQLLADGPMGPGRPDWPPPGGGFANSPNHLNTYQAPQVQPRFPRIGNYQPGYMPPGYASEGNRRFPDYERLREAPVFPPGIDWPGADYGHGDVVAPAPQPGYPVQVIPPPGIPLEGDIMDTTEKPVRHWRPEGAPLR